MKNFNKLAIFTFAMFGFTAAANAQSTATSGDVTTSATVVAPISITHTSALNFGEVIAKTGTVTLSPAGARSGDALGKTTTVISVPTFTVKGQAGYTYAIGAIAETTLTHSVTATSIMKVNGFTNSLGATTGTLAADGTQAFTVGATLNVTANQEAGAYNGKFNVTVNYN